MYYLVWVIDDSLAPPYECFKSERGITYLGYTTNEDIAQGYCKQWKFHDKKVWYVPTSKLLIAYIGRELGEAIPEIYSYTTRDGKRTVYVTEFEMEQMDELFCETDSYLDDIRYALEVLNIYKEEKTTKKVVKGLKRVLRVLSGDYEDEEDEDLLQDLSNHSDYAYQLALVIDRMKWFDYRNRICWKGEE